MIGTVGTANLEALARDGDADAAARLDDRRGVRRGLGGCRPQACTSSRRATTTRWLACSANSPALGVKRVGLVYRDDGLGTATVLAGAEAAAKTHGIELAAQQLRAQHGGRREAVADMVSAKVQVVFLGATTAAGIEFVKRYGAAGGLGYLYRHVHHRHRCAAEGARARAFARLCVLGGAAAGAADQRAVVREVPAAARDASEGCRTSRRARSRASSPPRRWSGARRHRQPDAGRRDRGARGGAYRSTWAATCSTSAPSDRPGSHYVDFAMFGAQGAHPAVAAAARPSADTLVAPFFTFTAARPRSTSSTNSSKATAAGR